MSLDPEGLAGELPQMSDRTLGLFIRANELVLQAFELLVPEGQELANATDCKLALRVALAERERRGQ